MIRTARRGWSRRGRSKPRHSLFVMAKLLEFESEIEFIADINDYKDCLMSQDPTQDNPNSLWFNIDIPKGHVLKSRRSCPGHRGKDLKPLNKSFFCSIRPALSGFLLVWTFRIFLAVICSLLKRGHPLQGLSEARRGRLVGGVMSRSPAIIPKMFRFSSRIPYLMRRLTRNFLKKLA